jgi:hypothetical protein
MSINESKYTAVEATFRNMYGLPRERSQVSPAWSKTRTRRRTSRPAAFKIAWEKRAQFRGESSLYTWLCAIAFNEARHSWRKETARLDSIDRQDAEELAAPELLSESLERKDCRLQIQKALRRLPAKYSRVSMDRFANGC